MKLKKEIKQKLLNDNQLTLRIAMKMNCSQAAIKALINRDSDKLCQLNYAELIKQVLKLHKSTKIYD